MQVRRSVEAVRPASGAGERRRRAAAHRLYAQLAWPTLSGLPLLDERRADVLERELIALCRRLDAEPLEVWVSADRVRLLVRFGPGQALADVARRLKRASGAALRRWGWAARWGRGYAVCSVGPAQVHRLVRRMRAERKRGVALRPPPERRRRIPGRDRSNPQAGETARG